MLMTLGISNCNTFAINLKGVATVVFTLLLRWLQVVNKSIIAGLKSVKSYQWLSSKSVFFFCFQTNNFLFYFFLVTRQLLWNCAYCITEVKNLNSSSGDSVKGFQNCRPQRIIQLVKRRKQHAHSHDFLSCGTRSNVASKIKHLPLHTHNCRLF